MRKLRNSNFDFDKLRLNQIVVGLNFFWWQNLNSKVRILNYDNTKKLKLLFNINYELIKFVWDTFFYVTISKCGSKDRSNRTQLRYSNGDQTKISNCEKLRDWNSDKTQKLTM